jgi:hypothetical protein
LDCRLVANSACKVYSKGDLLFPLFKFLQGNIVDLTCSVLLILFIDEFIIVSIEALAGRDGYKASLWVKLKIL